MNGKKAYRVYINKYCIGNYSKLKIKSNEQFVATGTKDGIEIIHLGKFQLLRIFYFQNILKNRPKTFFEMKKRRKCV